MDTNPIGAFSGALKSELKRAPEPQSGAELASLNQMLQQLNNPELELMPGMSAAPAAPAAAPMSPKGEFSAPEGSNGATMPVADPVFGEVSIPGAPAPAAMPPAPALAPVANSRLVMLTGRSGAGKDFVASKSGRTVLKLDSIVRGLMEEVFGRQPEAAIGASVATIMLWGRGIVSAKYPITPARMAVADMFRQRGWRGFGQPTFWTDMVIGHAEESSDPFVLVGVTDPEDFKRLAAAGFAHFHVVCSAQTYAQRPKNEHVDNNMAVNLDKQVQARINTPGQDKLRVIWSDTAKCPSNRFYSIPEWVALLNDTASVAVTGE